MLGNFLKKKLKVGLMLSLIAKVAQSQPHTAYSVFTKSLASHWVYVSLTSLDIATFMLPPQEVICYVLIPPLTGQTPPNDFECDLLTLPP